MSKLTMDDMRETWRKYVEDKAQYTDWGLVNLTSWLGERTGYLLRRIDRMQAMLDAQKAEVLWWNATPPPDWQRTFYTMNHEEGDMMPEETPTQLPCGCIRGKYLCPEAVELWEKSSKAYEQLCKDMDNADAYTRWQDALDDYNFHYDPTKLTPAYALCRMYLVLRDILAGVLDTDPSRALDEYAEDLMFSALGKRWDGELFDEATAGHIELFGLQDKYKGGVPK